MVLLHRHHCVNMQKVSYVRYQQSISCFQHNGAYLNVFAAVVSLYIVESYKTKNQKQNGFNMLCSSHNRQLCANICCLHVQPTTPDDAKLPLCCNPVMMKVKYQLQLSSAFQDNHICICIYLKVVYFCSYRCSLFKYLSLCPENHSARPCLPPLLCFARCILEEM